MINLNQLRFFYEAARCQNFSQAARNLYVTQPAVSGQIRALEDSLDVKLFKRRGRKMVLSEAGALLFQHARDVFDIEKKIERVIAEVRDLKRGVLKIGTTTTYARYLMPALITQFRATYPRLRIVLDEGSSWDVCRSLLDLRNDFGIVGMTEEVRGLTFVPFRKEEVLLFAAPSHPLARRKSITFRDLEGELVVLKEEGSSTEALVRSCFERHGLAPNVLVETSNLDFIKEMVERGEGLSFLVRSAIERDIAEGRVKAIPIRDQEMSLPVHVAYPSESDLTPAAQAFLGLLEAARD